MTRALAAKRAAVVVWVLAATSLALGSVRRKNFHWHQSRTLASWLAIRVGGHPLRSYAEATDATGRVVAGLGVEHEHKLISIEVTRMPALIAAANVFLRVIPRDRLLRNINVRFPWFLPGHQAAAQWLWRQLRWDIRDRGTNVVRSVDPTGPLARALPVPRWLPSTSLQIVIREPAGCVLLARPVGAVV